MYPTMFMDTISTNWTGCNYIERNFDSEGSRAHTNPISARAKIQGFVDRGGGQSPEIRNLTILDSLVFFPSVRVAVMGNILDVCDHNELNGV